MKKGTFALEWDPGHVAGTRERNGYGSIEGYSEGNAAGDNETQTLHATTCEGLEGTAALCRWRGSIDTAICQKIHTGCEETPYH